MGRQIFFFLLLPLMGGCILYDCGYTSNDSVREYEVNAWQKVPVSFSIELSSRCAIDYLDESEWSTSRLTLSRKVKEALEETALFSTVQEQPEELPGGYHFTFRFVLSTMDNSKVSSLGTFAGSTLFLIPAWIDAGFDGTAVVHLRTHTVYSIGAAEKIKCFIWLPLMPLGLFANEAVAWHFTEKGVINHLVNRVAAYHYETYCK